MTDTAHLIESVVALCIKGAEQFGDDPLAIAGFVDSELDKLDESARSRIKQALVLAVGVPEYSMNTSKNGFSAPHC